MVVYSVCPISEDSPKGKESPSNLPSWVLLFWAEVWSRLMERCFTSRFLAKAVVVIGTLSADNLTNGYHYQTQLSRMLWGKSKHLTSLLRDMSSVVGVTELLAKLSCRCVLRWVRENSEMVLAKGLVVEKLRLETLIQLKPLWQVPHRLFRLPHFTVTYSCPSSFECIQRSLLFRFITACSSCDSHSRNALRGDAP